MAQTITTINMKTLNKLPPEVAKIILEEAIVYEKKATADIDWDLEAIKGAQNSWKDEWLCVLFSIPMIMAFIPGLEGVVARGFEQLEMMPDWYQYSLGVIIAASFGIRSASKLFRR